MGGGEEIRVYGLVFGLRWIFASVNPLTYSCGLVCKCLTL